MMLNHLGERTAANRIKAAYNRVLGENNPAKRTRDIGGTASTEEFAEAIIKAME